MSTSISSEDNNKEITNSQNKVKVTDLLSRLNEEKKVEKKRNLALGVAAVSAATDAAAPVDSTLADRRELLTAA